MMGRNIEQIEERLHQLLHMLTKIYLFILFQIVRTTYFGSSVPLNRTNILTSIYPKTTAEYAEIEAAEQLARKSRNGDWPEYSEYTSRYLLHTPSEIKVNP